ncbi:ribosomal protein subunit Mrp21 [Schizosaccharomyces japonicus yFS275]|uniref:Ribosomal protein subunit Mrp21 n=1 Tax=Schizosaccharomyces japonicus (strain yFS275 / FY16936) TaxID=402676 RepID=B6K635_SCHJY|nr:ribosomal protein subunit Mrp21 [Schizosaccharomyces japonicus yFS275]EEB08989.1 ribosomal protein subunit Mrp21 [Schizosaccharomyces japonicus yFS275]
MISSLRKGTLHSWSGLIQPSISHFQKRFFANEPLQKVKEIALNAKRMQRMAPKYDLGATVSVRRSLSQTFSQLEALCARNNVRRQFYAQRFYEKPTARRSRLRSERHRARFRAGIIRLVKMAKELRKWGL